jgi:hypothetical protein
MRRAFFLNSGDKMDLAVIGLISECFCVYFTSDVGFLAVIVACVIEKLN